MFLNIIKKYFFSKFINIFSGRSKRQQIKEFSVQEHDFYHLVCMTTIC